ncbi:hypothetical protein [Veronia nyctiphanis]|uniref:hypothetical protein n=1 Tax=Veronia nyctiphanis TaxID=1278244 RepID=UPI00100B5AC1|nr:hypothetical protein [Veronia nyctiphanis]
MNAADRTIIRSCLEHKDCVSHVPLGVLPKLSEPDLSGRPFDHTLLPAHEEQDYGRAIRTIAAKLDCQLFSQKRQIIAVTSRKASEGKSTLP